MDRKVIAFTGGGTAGHVFPAFPVIDRLKAQGFDIVWIGSQRGMERGIVEDAGITYYGVPSGKLRRYFSLRNFTDLFAIAFGLLRSFAVLRRIRPAALVSKGGFVTVPPTAAARLLKIPTYTHESDVDPGLATRLNLKLGARALLSYEKTKEYLVPAVAADAVVTGNPVRDALLQGSRKEGRRIAGLGANDQRPLILVLGGSLGAREVNDLITGALDSLLGMAAVVHQSGKGNPTVPDRPGYLCRPFFKEELPHLLAAADLAIARSGAGSVWELAATSTPAFFIPLRGATRGDQLLNAALAQEAGMSRTLEEGIGTEAFLSLVKDLLAKKETLERMGSNAAAAYPAAQAADNISKVLTEDLT